MNYSEERAHLTDEEQEVLLRSCSKIRENLPNIINEIKNLNISFYYDKNNYCLVYDYNQIKQVVKKYMSDIEEYVWEYSDTHWPLPSFLQEEFRCYIERLERLSDVQ